MQKIGLVDMWFHPGGAKHAKQHGQLWKNEFGGQLILRFEPINWRDYEI